MHGGNFEADDWTSATVLKNWEQIGSITTAQITETNAFSKGSLKFTQSTTDKATAEGVRSMSGFSPSKGNQIGISFKYHLQVSDGSPSVSLTLPCEIGIAVVCGGRYLQSNNTWEAVSTILWFQVAGENLNAFYTQNLGLITIPSPAGQVIIELYEPYAGSFSVTYLKWDEINVLEYENGVQIAATEYKDIKCIAENSNLTSKNRKSLTLNCYDYPAITFHNFSSAVYSKLTITVTINGDTPAENDNVSFKMDGTRYTYVYKSSPAAAGSREWNLLQGLRDEIIGDSWNYSVVESGDDIVITAIDYDTAKDLGSYTEVDTNGLFSAVEVTAVEPVVDNTFTSKAAITADSAGASPMTETWVVNNEATSEKLWQNVAYRHLRTMATQNERLAGAIKVFNEGTDQFGALTGIIGDTGENSYFFIRGYFNIKMLEWEGEWMKLNNSSVTMVYTEYAY